MTRTNVLITGAHRSGTTWTAKVLSADTRVHYIAEPFNIGFNHPGSPVNYWFQYLDENRSFPDYEKYIKSLIKLGPYGIWNELPRGLKKGYHRAFVTDQWNKWNCPFQ